MSLAAVVDACWLNDNLERTGWARCVSLEPCASMPQWGTQTAGASMDDVISKLTAEQALKIVERLTRNGGKIRVAILAEAMNILN